MKITKQDFLDLGSNKLFIGDPCYVLSHEDYESGVVDVVENGYQFEGVEGTTSKGIPVTEWCDTKYGDGYYPSSSGIHYGVDAGILGVSVITDIENYNEKTLDELGQVITIPENTDYVGINVGRDSEDDGDVYIDVFIYEAGGKLNRINEVIYTAEDEESEEDDYYEDDEEEEFEESKKVSRKSIREASEKRAYRMGYLKGLKEHSVPFTELNDFTKEMIEEAAKDDYSMNHKNSAADLIEWIYGDEDVSPELARKAYDYYCDVYSELQSHSEDDDYFNDGEYSLEESKKSNKNSIRESVTNITFDKDVSDHTNSPSVNTTFDYTNRDSNSYQYDIHKAIDVATKFLKTGKYYLLVDDEKFEDPSVFDSENVQSMQLKLKESKKQDKKSIRESNRVGNNEFVPDYIDQFLEDVAQYSELFDYSDIIAFERDVFTPNDKNVRALKKLYRQAKEAIEANDEEDMNRIYQDVADLVTGVVDYEA